MHSLSFVPLPTERVRQLQNGGPDAYGNVPERRISDGEGVPCRHYLKEVPKGQPYLVLAHRPFATVQAYAETGPIFLCANRCAPGGGWDVPEILSSPHYILRGYDSAETIVYGTGSVVDRDQIPERASLLLSDSRIAFLHVRSASNNCYHVRIERTS